MPDERLDNLERLARMRDSGLLSNGEFEAEKRRILGSARQGFPAAETGTRSRGTIVIAATALGAVLAAGILWWLINGASGSGPKADMASPTRQEPPAPASPPARPAAVAAAAKKGEPAPPPAAERQAPSASPWIGDYEGRFEGGARGGVTIAARPNDRLHIDIGVGSPGCAGGLTARVAAPRGNRLVITMPRDDSGNQCRITMTRSGNRLTVAEDSCMYYHGFECSFTGAATR